MSEKTCPDCKVEQFGILVYLCPLHSLTEELVEALEKLRTRVSAWMVYGHHEAFGDVPNTLQEIETVLARAKEPRK